jgi:hypothetical protein
MYKYAVGALALCVIGGGVLWYVQSRDTTTVVPSPTAIAPGDRPWIEVVTDSGMLTDTTGATSTLQTGDEVSAGDSIKTNATGVVLVHFADGSFAQLDPNSSVTITQADYDQSSGAANVDLSLSTGTLWSKVLDLVGISSSWKVETSNAVATVRGTSFGTVVTSGETKVLGIEHTVAVTPLQPATHQPLATSTETDVTPNAQVTISDRQIPSLASGKARLLATAASAAITTSATYKKFNNRAAQFDTIRDSLTAKLGNGAEFRKEFREAQVANFKNQILERRTATYTQHKQELDDRVNVNQPPTTNPKTQPVLPSTPASTSVVSSTDTPSTTIHPVSLVVTSDQDLSAGTTDGDTVAFHATLIFSDNSKKDVTATVKWNVINNVGIFATPGTFQAQLSSNAAELGVVPGAVYATFTGSDGKELNAASTEFNVHAFVPPQTTTNG